MRSLFLDDGDAVLAGCRGLVELALDVELALQGVLWVGRYGAYRFAPGVPTHRYVVDVPNWPSGNHTVVSVSGAALAAAGADRTVDFLVEQWEVGEVRLGWSRERLLAVELAGAGAFEGALSRLGFWWPWRDGRNGTVTVKQSGAPEAWVEWQRGNVVRGLLELSRLGLAGLRG